jgi:hypothetical protein
VPKQGERLEIAVLPKQMGSVSCIQTAVSFSQSVSANREGQAIPHIDVPMDASIAGSERGGRAEKFVVGEGRNG